METGKATAAVVAAAATTAIANGRCETMMEKAPTKIISIRRVNSMATMMEKAPPKIISIRRINSMEIKLDTIYEDTTTTTVAATTTTAQVTEKQISLGDSKAIPRVILSPGWLKTKPSLLDVHQGGATSA